MGILNVVTYTPLLGAAIILFFIRSENGKAIRYAATLFAAIDFVVSLFLWWGFDPNAGGEKIFQFRWVTEWIPSLGVKYDFGIDGIALLLIILTTFMGLIAIVSSFSAIDYRQKEYYVLLLLLQTGMIGTFCALDFFLFYVFWEIMLVPMYFIIGIWGGSRKLYAAIKFFLYTLAGSVLMLLSILALYFFNDGGIPFLHIRGLGNPSTFSVLQYHNIGHLIPPQLQFWNSTLRMYIDYNGNMTENGTITATSFSTSSDRNIKENFEPINPRLSRLLSCRTAGRCPNRRAGEGSPAR